MAQKIIVEPLNDGQVLRVTLNAPKANVLDGEMMNDIQEVLDVLSDQDDVKLVQFTGAGDHFCFGASVPEHTKEKAPEMLKHFHKLFYTLADLAIPTAAIVSGQCLGGGMELALMCNFMFVDKTAKLGQPEIMLGVFAPPAIISLPALKSSPDYLLPYTMSPESSSQRSVTSKGLRTNLPSTFRTGTASVISPKALAS